MAKSLVLDYTIGGATYLQDARIHVSSLTLLGYLSKFEPLFYIDFQAVIYVLTIKHGK